MSRTRWEGTGAGIQPSRSTHRPRGGAGGGEGLHASLPGHTCSRKWALRKRSKKKKEIKGTNKSDFIELS